jgi:hypothetical protein
MNSLDSIRDCFAREIETAFGRIAPHGQFKRPTQFGLAFHRDHDHDGMSGGGSRFAGPKRKTLTSPPTIGF